MPTDYIPTAEVARRLGVTVRTVSRMVERGELVPVIRGEGIRGPMFFEADCVPDQDVAS